LEQVETFEVIEPGILTTIQDLGRYGFSQFGVPPSGATDTFSLRVANLLVGNREEEACLEMMLMGLKIKALKEVVIGITGGDLCPTLNEEPLEMWRTHLLVEGDVITFKKVRAGCRAYLAVGGRIRCSKDHGKFVNLSFRKIWWFGRKGIEKRRYSFIHSIAHLLNKLGIRFRRIGFSF
jgi:antagonist of KipI